MSITEQTRNESYDELRKSLSDKQEVVMFILENYGEMTAREIAKEMYEMCITNTNERNNAQPRLNELVKKNLVEVVGKKHDDVTNRNVALYKVVIDK